MIPAVSYLRMSTDKQDTSIAAQRSAVAGLAKSHGYKIVREYVDLGVSGDDTERRLDFQRMIADAAKGGFRAVLCWDQDRFGRFDPLEAGFWIKPLRDHGIQLVTVAQGLINWNDVAGRMLYTIHQEGKHQYLRDLSKNVMRGMVARAKEGIWICGDPPYGFRIGPDQKLVPEPEQSRIIRQIFKLYLSGTSVRKIAEALNEQGATGPRGGAWHGTSIYRTMRNPAVAGSILYGKTTESKYSAVESGMIVSKQSAKPGLNHASNWILVENAHPAIVSKAIFDKAAKQFQEGFRFPGPRRGFPSLFKGLLKCGHCGRSMHGQFVSKVNDMAYVCARHAQTGLCQPNRAYQKEILSVIQQTLKGEFLSRQAIAQARAAIVANLKADTGPTPDSARRALDSQRAKLARAEQRLLEVDKDLVQTVSAQIRTLRQAVEHAESVYRAVRVPRQTLKQEQLAAMEVAQQAYREICESEQPTEELMMLLRSVLDQVVVTAVKDPPGYRTPSGRYRLVKLTIRAKTIGKSR